MKTHLAYLRYVLRHKREVFLAGLQLGVPLWQLIIHDLSKFSPMEWGPYVAYFYGPRYSEDERRVARNILVSYLPSDQDIQDSFDAAWLHHQHANPHHWQHWVLREDDGGTKVLPMPFRYAKEMVADWMGAGAAMGNPGDTPNWYAKNRDNILLHPHTRELVEFFIGDL